jgi:hypothetical protein
MRTACYADKADKQASSPINPKKSKLMSSKSILLFVTAMALLLFAGAPEIAAQTPPPPALPGMPDQAPLGGISLLAAAGGAYAWLKLRNRRDN